MAQPPLVEHPPATLHAALATLAIGGAERIVLDWTASVRARHRVRLIVLRDVAPEWPVPDGVELVRLAGQSPAALERAGAAIAASGNPRVLCHLLTGGERAALARGGAEPVAVIHNARAGWIEPADALRDAACTLAVSCAAAQELTHAGVRNVKVVRHLPPRRPVAPGLRSRWRERWRIPTDALVIGMIGAVKPQKAYPRAMQVLAALLARRDAFLVVLGGPVGRDGEIAWQALLVQVLRLGLSERVRLPGFVPDAADALPAFDLLLNTSRYEGRSVATMEALGAGLPVVAADVGGQREIEAPALTLLAHDAPPEVWADTILHALRAPRGRPAWAGFATARLWTLMHLALPGSPGRRVLFVTANLNAGGAQRSLVNLLPLLAGRLDLSLAVCGDSTAAAFIERLATARMTVHRTAGSREAFDHAEAIVRVVLARAVGRVVLWNVDARVKLLVGKCLAGSCVRLIDVSPGGYAFDEIDAIADFQRAIAFDATAYHACLDRLVLKYDVVPPVRARTTVIPNGVALPVIAAQPGATPVRRVVVSGRIAPSKYLLEIVAAMRIVWRDVPDARLTLLGTAEPRHAGYARALETAIGDEHGRRIVLAGAAFDAPERLGAFDVALVLGHHQGSPNAVLEALAAGLAVVANDSGGTRSMVIDGRTGLLLQDREPVTIAAALVRLMQDPRLAARLAAAGRRHVARRFSMAAMARAYARVLA